jgi:hypothetical protein
MSRIPHRLQNDLRSFRTGLQLVIWLIASLSGIRTAIAQTDAERHFEQTIGPLLTRHCLECHSSGTREGGLDLSSRESMQRGGDSGPAIVPGRFDQSRLWQLIDDDEMPKDRPPLTADEKRLIRRWIEAGAVRGAGRLNPFAVTTERRAGLDWWSLQPVRQPAVPGSTGDSRDRHEIDRFIQARLTERNLKPAPEADARTLIRRLWFDLLGLPPSPEDMAYWLPRLTNGSQASPHLASEQKSPSPVRNDEAYRALVDHLLASPHYGERWARHWLDVVRFGETQGYERNRIRPSAWRYRDWVIQALNDDLPYDDFIRLQLAGDVLRSGDYDAVIATGYHVCGTWDQVAAMEGSALMQQAARQDHLEDLVATLGQAFLGLTINCARCHDHKFDPIPQADYYRIAALLGGVSQDRDEVQKLSLTRDPLREKSLRDQLAETTRALAELEVRLRASVTPEHPETSTTIEGLLLLLREGSQPGVLEAHSSGPGGVLSLRAFQAGSPHWRSEQAPEEIWQAIRKAGEFTLEVWFTAGKVPQSGPARIVTGSLDTGRRNFTLGQDGDRIEVRFRTTKTSENGQPALSSSTAIIQPQRRTHVVFTFGRDGVAQLFVDGKRSARHAPGGDLTNWDDRFLLAVGNELTGDRPWDGTVHFAAVYNRTLSAREIQTHFETQSSGVTGRESLEQIIAKAGAADRSLFVELRSRREQLEHALVETTFQGPAHIVIPKQPPVFHVLARGDFRKPLEAVAPAGLSAFIPAGLSADFGLPENAPEAQRRVKLAEWMTDRRNPLTARVLVNRLWQHHFGRGLIPTPSDFGFNGGRPSHPDLLDWLASRFMAGGWKIKDMHRLMLLSATWRQSSQVKNPVAERIDANNELLWRAGTRRLEGEVIRDAALAVSGALNRTIGGPSFRDVAVNEGKMGTNSEFTEPTSEFSDAVNRRTIYRLWARSGNNPLLESLDCPDPSVMAPQRSQTITPVQALSLLNNSLMENCAQRLAARTVQEAGRDDAARIVRLWQLTLARAPSEREAEQARRFLQSETFEQLCLVLLNTNEFLFVN